MFAAHFLSLCFHLSQGPVVGFGVLEKAVGYLDLCSAMSHVYILQEHSEVLTDSHAFLQHVHKDCLDHILLCVGINKRF